MAEKHLPPGWGEKPQGPIWGKKGLSEESGKLEDKAPFVKAEKNEILKTEINATDAEPETITIVSASTVEIEGDPSEKPAKAKDPEEGTVREEEQRTAEPKPLKSPTIEEQPVTAAKKPKERRGRAGWIAALIVFLFVLGGGGWLAISQFGLPWQKTEDRVVNIAEETVSEQAGKKEELPKSVEPEQETPGEVLPEEDPPEMATEAGTAETSKPDQSGKEVIAEVPSSSQPAESIQHSESTEESKVEAPKKEEEQEIHLEAKLSEKMEEVVEEVPAVAVYDALLAGYQEFSAIDSEEFLAAYYNGQLPGRFDGINFDMLADYFRDGSDIYYGYTDFNGDDVQELVIALQAGEYMLVRDVYTFADGWGIAVLFDGDNALAYRVNLFVLNDGSFMVHGSSGAMSGSDTICRIREDCMGIEELVRFDYDEYTYGNMDHVSENERLTEEEFQARYWNQAIPASEANGLELHPLSSWEGPAANSALSSKEDTANDDGITAAASSVLPDDGALQYVPANVLDGKSNTAWAEGKEDSGIGEYIELTLPAASQIHGISILNGYCKSKELYQKNNRIKACTIMLDNGRSYRVELSDVYAYYQDLYFPQMETTGGIRIQIDTVYPGTEWDDTLISEIGLLL